MEEIGRLLRQVNDAAESLDHERGDEADGFDFGVRRGLSWLGHVTPSYSFGSDVASFSPFDPKEFGIFGVYSMY